VAAKLRHPCRKRLPSSFNAGSGCIIVWLANVFRFDQGRRRPHFPLGGLSIHVFKWFQRFRWTSKHKDIVDLCIDFVKREHFETLARGRSLIDGMSADASVFLYGTVEDVEANCIRVRVDYSVKYKATIDALGSYRVTYCNSAISEISHEERAC
jgi:hypothetical protein